MSAKPDVYLYGQVLGAHSFLLIASFQEVMHIAVTAAVLLSIAALVCLIVAGCRDRRDRGIAAWASRGIRGIDMCTAFVRYGKDTSGSTVSPD